MGKLKVIEKVIGDKKKLLNPSHHLLLLALSQNNHFFASITRLCEKAADGYKQTCFQNINFEMSRIKILTNKTKLKFLKLKALFSTI